MLRVSVAILNRVVFLHPQNAVLMLALERRATARGQNNVHVRAQPFGGAVRILNPAHLQEILGDIQFYSERAKHEQDFRILIPPSSWEEVKRYCLRHLQNPIDRELESLPHRELQEEFLETIQVHLHRNQYTFQPLGSVVEGNPIPTDNAELPGLPTVRLYRIFEVRVMDELLCKKMVAASQAHSDRDLEMLAVKDLQNGGKGRANSILTLPLHVVTESCLEFASEVPHRKIVVENHELDVSVLAILGEGNVPQYRRV